jgi:hypothetical protein
VQNKSLEILGWSGGVLLIVAYGLNSYNVIPSQSVSYQGINFIGSIMLAYYTYKKKAFPNVALNLIWAVIALIAILSIVR